MKILERVIRSKTLQGLLMLLAFWYLVHFIIKSNIVPNPRETGLVFLKLLRADMLLHLGVSLLRIITSVGMAMVIGVPLGLWMGFNKKVDNIISPLVYILYPIPKIAFLPVFMLLFGLGDTSKVILIITIIVLQILLATRDGVKEIPQQLIYSVKSLSIDTRGMYQHLVFPAVLPKIISALRISVGIGISVLFFSENFATSYGIGYFIMHMWAILKYKEMYAGIIGLSLMCFFIVKGLDYVERNLCSWIFIE